MTETRYRDPIHDDVLVTFDGTVVEVFTTRSGSVLRLHLAMLDLAVSGPDRKGYRTVRLSTGRKFASAFSCLLDEAAWASSQAFWSETHAVAIEPERLRGSR